MLSDEFVGIAGNHAVEVEFADLHLHLIESHRDDSLFFICGKAVEFGINAERLVLCTFQRGQRVGL